MVVIYGYLERGNDKVSKFHMDNSSVFEKKHLPILSVTLN